VFDKILFKINFLCFLSMDILKINLKNKKIYCFYIILNKKYFKK
jgi:hypothetical protein